MKTTSTILPVILAVAYVIYCIHWAISNKGSKFKSYDDAKAYVKADTAANMARNQPGVGWAMDAGRVDLERFFDPLHPDNNNTGYADQA